ncbi:MAG: TIM barrel protein [Phycisphaeraceae bacterium]
MGILTHGAEMTLAATIGPLVRAGVGPRQSAGTVRGALEALVGLTEAGIRGVQLDVSLPGLRPRELSPRQRKDLLALLGRKSLRLAGIELFIPRRHYTDAAQVDRAMAATLAAVELAADLGRVPLSLALPVADMGDDARSAIVAAADGKGVTLAVHAEDQVDALLEWLEAVGHPSIGAGVDAAAVLALNGKPQDMAHRLAGRLKVGRLSDQSSGVSGGGCGGPGGLRCAIGHGELDVMAYRVALDLATARVGPVVLDLRGLENPLAAAEVGSRAWADAGSGMGAG